MTSSPIDYATFWEHIEELRKCVIKSISVIITGILLAFFFYPSMIGLLTAPYYATMNSLEKGEVSAETVKYTKVSNHQSSPTTYSIPEGGRYVEALSQGVQHQKGKLYIIDHQGFITYETVSSPNNLVVLGPTEGIVTAFKVSFWVGLAVTSPFWLYFFASFITPALRTEESRALLPFLSLSLLFFASGALFSYFLTIPFANHYLALFNANISINLWSLAQYVDYTLLLILANGIAFETAIILFTFVHYRLISHHTLKEKRRYATVAAFVIAAVLTPPDVVTQLMLALPLILLYETAILYAGWRRKYEKTTILPAQ